VTAKKETITMQNLIQENQRLKEKVRELSETEKTARWLRGEENPESKNSKKEVCPCHGWEDCGLYSHKDMHRVW